MDDQPRNITLISIRTKRRRTIHLLTKTSKKSFKSASKNSKIWVKKCGYPFVLRVKYGVSEINRKPPTNSMDCNNSAEFNWGLIAFVKEYMM